MFCVSISLEKLNRAGLIKLRDNKYTLEDMFNGKHQIYAQIDKDKRDEFFRNNN